MATSSCNDNSELVCQAVPAVVADNYLTVEYKRAKRFQKTRKEIVGICTSQEHSWYFKIGKRNDGRCRLASSKQARLWTSFYTPANNNVPKIWTTFFNGICQPTQDNSVYCTTQGDTLFQPESIWVPHARLLCQLFTSEVVLGKDELNTVITLQSCTSHSTENVWTKSPLIASETWSS